MAGSFEFRQRRERVGGIHHRRTAAHEYRYIESLDDFLPGCSGLQRCETVGEPFRTMVASGALEAIVMSPPELWDGLDWWDILVNTSFIGEVRNSQ